MARIFTLSRWYWPATAVCLTLGVAGLDSALYWAVAINTVQTIHVIMRERSLESFSVQVRVVFLAGLLAAQWPPLYIVNWLLCANVIASVTVDYCPLARLLSLLPANRTQPLTIALLYRTIFSKPVKGNMLQNAVLN